MWAGVRALLLGAALLAGPGCGDREWSEAEREVAVQKCRSRIRLERVTIFTRWGPAHESEMCRCKVDVIADRIPWRLLTDGEHPLETNLALAAAVNECTDRLEPYRRGRAAP